MKAVADLQFYIEFDDEDDLAYPLSKVSFPAKFGHLKKETGHSLAEIYLFNLTDAKEVAHAIHRKTLDVVKIVEVDSEELWAFWLGGDFYTAPHHDSSEWGWWINVSNSYISHLHVDSAREFVRVGVHLVGPYPTESDAMRAIVTRLQNK